MKQLFAALKATIGFREAMLFAGTGLIASGLFLVWAPAALIVPGALFAYIAIFGVR